MFLHITQQRKRNIWQCPKLHCIGCKAIYHCNTEDNDSKQTKLWHFQQKVHIPKYYFVIDESLKSLWASRAEPNWLLNRPPTAAEQRKVTKMYIFSSHLFINLPRVIIGVQLWRGFGDDSSIRRAFRGIGAGISFTTIFWGEDKKNIAYYHLMNMKLWSM